MEDLLLGEEEILGLLGSEGPFAMAFPHYEPRLEQKEMLRNTLAAYREGHLALVEAGTGVGKSLAYLLPAIFWSQTYQERTLISTNTITLQEQLLKKDLPQLLQVLGVELKVVLAKGMGNYLCLRKLAELDEEQGNLPFREQEEIEDLQVWAEETEDGTLSDIPFSPSHNSWERINADSYACAYKKCSFYKDCWFFKARREAENANILLVNHHLLCADLAVRAEAEDQKPVGILPDYERVVIDEAHHLEDVASDHFASRISRSQIFRTFQKLATEKKNVRQGKLFLLRSKMAPYFANQDNPYLDGILTRLDVDILGRKHGILVETEEAFEAALEFLSREHSAGAQSLERSQKFRLKAHHERSVNWQGSLEPKLQDLGRSLKTFSQSLLGWLIDLENLDNEDFLKAVESHLIEIRGLATRIADFSQQIKGFCQNLDSLDEVRWLETQVRERGCNVTLVRADLDVSEKLAKSLFRPLKTGILCSATLSTNKSFEFIKKSIGLTQHKLPDKIISENLYESPFDFRNQSLLSIPRDLPDQRSPEYFSSLCDLLLQTVRISAGNAFFLFTSYSLLNRCYQVLAPQFLEEGLVPLKQGEDSRAMLLKKFIKEEGSVLFGTDSFWEGVDVAGDALRCVVITKLPFKVPTEPMVEARSEAITRQGGSPFWDEAVPHAIVKFKQGFGRLIRHKEDFGCVLVLDPRLMTKNYGREFLKSLPSCQVNYLPKSEMLGEMKKFYAGKRGIGA